MPTTHRIVDVWNRRDPRITLNYQYQRRHLFRYFLRRFLVSRARKSDRRGARRRFRTSYDTASPLQLRIYANDVTIVPRRDSEFMCRRNVRRGIVRNSLVARRSEPETERDRSSCWKSTGLVLPARRFYSAATAAAVSCSNVTIKFIRSQWHMLSDIRAAPAYLDLWYSNVASNLFGEK